MKKFLAMLAISVFILAGCEQSSSVVAPDNTNSELKKETSKSEVLQKEDSEPADPRI